MWGSVVLGSVVPVGAVAFDAFTLLDFRQLPATAERLFPGQGARFEEVWRTRLFDYSWLRVLGETMTS